MSELSPYCLKQREDFSCLDISSAKAAKETSAKTLRHLITSDPADHLGRQKQALELQSIIDLSECIHIGDSRLSLCSIPQILTEVMAIPELTARTYSI